MSAINQNFGQIIKTLRTKSAANPALMFAALCLAAGLPGALLADMPVSYVFVGISVLGVVLAAFQILFFTFTDPDRLHDEEHVENKLLINAMAPMFGDAHKIIEVRADDTLTGNPQLEDKSDV